MSSRACHRTIAINCFVCKFILEEKTKGYEKVEMTKEKIERIKMFDVPHHIMVLFLIKAKTKVVHANK